MGSLLRLSVAAGVMVNAGAMADGLEEVPVASLERVALQSFDEAISSAAKADEPWVYDSLDVALLIVGDFEGRSQVIQRRHDVDSTTGKADIVVIEDGYLDDSVRGARFHITLETDAQGIWRPTLVERAWRCWPGRGHESFAKEPCL